MFKKIYFYPHHFLCAMNFQGKGYSEAFINNFQKILDQLKSNPDQEIIITNRTDSICNACPHKKENQCKALFISLNKRHEKAFGFIPGDCITWKEALLRIEQRLSLSVFHHICEGCKWKNLKICETNVNNILL